MDAEGEEVVEGNKYINVSQLSLVDLAGSERHGRTQASGERLKEAGTFLQNNNRSYARWGQSVLCIQVNFVLHFQETSTIL